MKVDPMPLPNNIKEKDFQNMVVKYAQHCGWLIHHTRPANPANGQPRSKATPGSPTSSSPATANCSSLNSNQRKGACRTNRTTGWKPSPETESGCGDPRTGLTS